MTFNSLGLAPAYLRAVADEGYTEPTPVQREAIPAVLAGGDLLVSSQTGSGKTAAFVLPGLQRLRTSATRPGIGPRMLVLTPTRELAMQVQKATHGYCTGQRLRTACLVGGMPFRRQLDEVRKPLDIVIATPGRLKDHMDRGSLSLDRVELLVSPHAIGTNGVEWGGLPGGSVAFLDELSASPVGADVRIEGYVHRAG